LNREPTDYESPRRLINGFRGDSFQLEKDRVFKTSKASEGLWKSGRKGLRRSSTSTKSLPSKKRLWNTRTRWSFKVLSNAVGSGLIRVQVGDPAAACHSRKERVRTKGPPVAFCQPTFHGDISSGVCFAYSNNSLVVVGSGGRCAFWVPFALERSIRSKKSRITIDTVRR
jgi:hypothetical protein